jgi:hypothetical protein
MRHDLRSINDEALLEACSLLPWELRLHRFVWSGTGCLTWLILYSLPLVAFYLLPRRPHITASLIVAAAVFTLIPAALTYLGIDALANRRRNVYWAELKRRYGGADLGVYLRDTQDEAEAGRGRDAEACIVLSGWALPHGGAWVVRAWLRPDGGWVERATLRPHFLSDERADEVRVATGEASLSAEDAADLKRLADAATKDWPRRVVSAVMDGVPVEVAVWVRGRGIVRLGSCNLAGIPDRKRNLPVVQLMLRVSELGGRVNGPPVAFGAYDGQKNQIQLGEV